VAACWERKRRRKKRTRTKRMRRRKWRARMRRNTITHEEGHDHTIKVGALVITARALGIARQCKHYTPHLLCELCKHVPEPDISRLARHLETTPAPGGRAGVAQLGNLRASPPTTLFFTSDLKTKFKG
jgi:hypothetical protein